MKNYVEVPDPCDHGWTLDNGALVPKWCEKEILPEDLTELLDGFIESEEEDKDLVMEVNDSDESDEES